MRFQPYVSIRLLLYSYSMHQYVTLILKFLCRRMRMPLVRVPKIDDLNAYYSTIAAHYGGCGKIIQYYMGMACTFHDVGVSVLNFTTI